jgi:hypothetical protein
MAGKVIRSVSTKFTADISDFDKKMASFSKKMKNVSKDLSSVGSSMTKGITLPAMAVATGLGALVLKTAEYGDNIDEMSQRTGLSIKTLQQLKYVSGQVGVEFESVESSFAKFTTTMKGALTGGKGSELFKALNIQLKDQAGNIRPVNELYMESIKKIGGLSDETLQSLAANELFGKSFESIIPLMRLSGSEMQTMMDKAVDLGLVMGDADVKAMGALNDKITEVKSQFEAMGMRIATKLLPVMEDKLIPALENKIIPAFINIADKIGKLIDKFTDLDPKMQTTILAVTGLAVAFGPALSGLGNMIGLLSKLPGLASTASTALAGLGLSAGALGAAGLMVGVAAVTLPKMYKENEDKLKKQAEYNKAKEAGNTRPMMQGEKMMGGFSVLSNDQFAEKFAATQKETANETSAVTQILDDSKKAAAEYEAMLKKLFGETAPGAVDKLKELKDSAKSFVSAIKEQTKAFANFVGLFDVFERKSVSGDRLLNRLKAQVKAMGEWRNSLTSLEKKGVSKELISDLRSMGAGSVDSVNALAKMSDSQLKEYQSLYGQKYSIAGSESSKMFASDQKAQTVIEKQINLTVTGSKGDAEVIVNAIVKKLRLAGYNI